MRMRCPASCSLTEHDSSYDGDDGWCQGLAGLSQDTNKLTLLGNHHFFRVILGPQCHLLELTSWTHLFGGRARVGLQQSPILLAGLGCEYPHLALHPVLGLCFGLSPFGRETQRACLSFGYRGVPSSLSDRLNSLRKGWTIQDRGPSVWLFPEKSPSRQQGTHLDFHSIITIHFGTSLVFALLLLGLRLCWDCRPSLGLFDQSFPTLTHPGS